MKAHSVLGAALECLQLTVKRKMSHKLLSMSNNSGHSMSKILIKQHNVLI